MVSLVRWILCATLLWAPLAVAQDRVTLSFVNADLDAVVRAIGSFTGRTFVIDPRVKGTINLVSEKPLTRAEALNALTAALRLQGFAIVEVGGVARITPEADAKFQGGGVGTSKVPASARGDQILTHVFRLQHESAQNVLAVVRPLVPANNPVTAYAGSNSLVVTDYAENLRRIEKVIEALDTPPSSGIEVVTLKNAIATDVATLVAKLNEQTAQPPDPAQRVVVLADPPTNSVVIRSASPARSRAAKALVESLDQPPIPGSGVYVVPLKNAEAKALAETLTGIRAGDAARPGGQPRSLDPAAGARPRPVELMPGTASQLPAGLEGVTSIVADPASNSLVVTASEGAYRALRAVIDKLDLRRAQVFIECLIVEVRGDLGAEFGIQWLAGLENFAQGGTSVGGGTNFGGPTQNIVSGATNIGNLGRGLNIGVVSGEVTLPGLGTVTNLAFLARALETSAKANILSTPNILTLDNQEANLLVGQNVPFITGQFTTQSSGGATVNPFQTIERRDVGLTLKVKPQISEGGTIRLAIYQEVSSVVDDTNPAGVVTNKRSLETSVLVDDGSIIVLGGLVQDEIGVNVEKVPVLGDIPLLGHLFRYESRSRIKTNLMLFLRPYVIRGPSSADVLTVDRYDYMRKLQQETQMPPHFAIPSFEGPVLPEVHMGQKARPGDAGAGGKPEASQ
jgi:general secretion pathway protein D